jgi:hypothetical protein
MKENNQKQIDLPLGSELGASLGIEVGASVGVYVINEFRDTVSFKVWAAILTHHCYWFS